MSGITFAIDNIRDGNTAGRSAGWAADQLPHSERAGFLADVRSVEALGFSAHRKIENLLRGSASYGDTVGLPAQVIAELRQRDSSLDYILSLVEQGIATPHLPPYED